MPRSAVICTPPVVCSRGYWDVEHPYQVWGRRGASARLEGLRCLEITWGRLPHRLSEGLECGVNRLPQNLGCVAQLTAFLHEAFRGSADGLRQVPYFPETTSHLWRCARTRSVRS